MKSTLCFQKQSGWLQTLQATVTRLNEIGVKLKEGGGPGFQLEYSHWRTPESLGELHVRLDRVNEQSFATRPPRTNRRSQLIWDQLVSFYGRAPSRLVYLKDRHDYFAIFNREGGLLPLVARRSSADEETPEFLDIGEWIGVFMGLPEVIDKRIAVAHA